LRNLSFNKKGFSLVETVIATVIIAVGLIPTVSMMVRMRTGFEQRIHKATAFHLAQNLMDLIQSKNWDEQSGYPPAYVLAPSVLGPDGEFSISDFDDIDDFHNFPFPSISGFTRSVKVEYVNVIFGNDVTTSIPTTDFKRVTITVTGELSSSKSRTIQTIMGNIN